jgi:hypothetical protein
LQLLILSRKWRYQELVPRRQMRKAVLGKQMVELDLGLGKDNHLRVIRNLERLLLGDTEVDPHRGKVNQ